MPATADTIRITLCCSPAARQVQQTTLTLPTGATVQHALQLYATLPACAAASLTEAVQAGRLSCGIWNARAQLHTVLHDGDRLEVYRPLTADPKTARRERFARQGGAKTAGLFNTRRPGAKAGY